MMMIKFHQFSTAMHIKKKRGVLVNFMKRLNYGNRHKRMLSIIVIISFMAAILPLSPGVAAAETTAQSVITDYIQRLMRPLMQAVSNILVSDLPRIFLKI